MNQVSLESTEVANLVNAARQSFDIAKAYVVDGPDMYSLAGNELKEIKSRRKAIDDQRKMMTKPLDESKAAIMDFFRTPLSMLDDAEAAIKRAMLTYQQEEQRKEREAREKAAAEARLIEAEAKAQNPDAPPPVVIMPPVKVAEVPKVKGISTRKVWKARVADAAQVPREYLLVDEQKLGALARATEGSVQVPGVEFYSEDILASGRG